MNRSGTLRALLVASLLTLVGQLVLVALGPLTRAGRASGGSAGPGGIALLSSDSLYYLELSRSPTILDASPLTRIALPHLLRLGSTLGSAEFFAVVVNLIALTLAGMALFDLGRRLGGTSTAGALAAAALTVNPLTAQWARFVLTETLSYAAVIGLLWVVARPERRRSVGALALMSAIGVVLTTLRPNGILVVAGAFAALTLTTMPRTPRLRITALHAMIWVVAVLFFLLGSREPTLGSARTSQLVVGLLYSGVVVEGTPDVLVTTAMPAPADVEDRSLTAAAGYVIDHPVAATRLGALRIAYETLQLRPHYPTVVNIGMAFGIAVFLGSAAVGARAAPSGTLRRAVLLIGLPQVLLIAATFAVPESRYGWTYLVTLCAWAGIGADRLLRRARPARSRPPLG